MGGQPWRVPPITLIGGTVVVLLCMAAMSGVNLLNDAAHSVYKTGWAPSVFRIWNQSGSTTLSLHATASNVTRVVPGTSKASNATRVAPGVRLFVGVLSSPANFKARSSIRATWGSDKGVAKLAFFTLRPQNQTLFQKLRREAVELRDVVVTPEVWAHYHNITYSTLEIFKTAVRIGEFTHVLKTDDDCYIRISLLLSALANMPTQWLYAGWPMWDQTLEWATMHRVMPKLDLPRQVTVRYGYGLGYIVSSDIAREIAAGAPLMVMEPDNFVIREDVAVGHWVGFISKEQHIDINYQVLKSGLDCNNTYVMVHLETTAQPPWAMMQCMYEHQDQCCSCTSTGCVVIGGVR